MTEFGHALTRHNRLAVKTLGLLTGRPGAVGKPREAFESCARPIQLPNVESSDVWADELPPTRLHQSVADIQTWRLKAWRTELES